MELKKLLSEAAGENDAGHVGTVGVCGEEVRI